MRTRREPVCNYDPREKGFIWLALINLNTQVAARLRVPISRSLFDSNKKKIGIEALGGEAREKPAKIH